MISMMTQITRKKPTLWVPPWASVQIAKTEAEKENVTNQHIRFMKDASGRGHASYADGALMELWRSTIVNDLTTKIDQFPRAEGNPALSVNSLRKLVCEIGESTGNPINSNEIYYVVFPTHLADVARRVRNHLSAKERHHPYEVETDGAVYRTEAYWTYTLDVEVEGQIHQATVAFCEIPGNTSLGSHAWLVLQQGDDPALTCWVDPDRPPFMSPTTALKNTDDVELRAIAAIRDAAEKNGLAVENEIHEPNGSSQFPDFQILIGGQKWELEVTRVLGDIVGKRIITIGKHQTEEYVRRAAKAPPLLPSDIHKAVEKAISDKAARSPRLSSNATSCLVLVDTLEQLELNDDSYWGSFDLTAFDVIAVARIEENSRNLLHFVKGSIGSNQK